MAGQDVTRKVASEEEGQVKWGRSTLQREPEHRGSEEAVWVEQEGPEAPDRSWLGHLRPARGGLNEGLRPGDIIRHDFSRAAPDPCHQEISLKRSSLSSQLHCLPQNPSSPNPKVPSFVSPSPCLFLGRSCSLPCHWVPLC